MQTFTLYFFSLAFTIGKCRAICPDTWVSYHGSCYLFSTEAKSFTESEHFCRQENAHLVKVENKQESLFLISFSNELKDAAHWIGLTDANIEGIWRWTDGSYATFTDFHHGEPNAYTSANCAALWVDHHYQWADEQCNRAYRPICEKQESSCEAVVG